MSPVRPRLQGERAVALADQECRTLGFAMSVSPFRQQRVVPHRRLRRTEIAASEQREKQQREHILTLRLEGPCRPAETLGKV
jgi:hypothetical protein